MANRRARHHVRQAERLRRIRIGIIAAIGVVVVGFGGAALFYGTGADVGGEPAEGEHYRVVTPPDGAPRALEVVEYFSYACVHCRNFDPLIEEWRTTLPEGVRFRRAHVAFNPAIGLLARAHVALGLEGALEANHDRIFRALHDRNRQFATAEALADYVDGFGIDRERFLTAMRSPRVARTVAENDQAFRDMTLVSVPSLAVAGKYVVNMDIGRKQALEVAERLVLAELESRAAEDAESGSDESG